MDRIMYKGFEIEAAPYQLADSKKWKLHIVIWEHKGYESVPRPISVSNSYDTKEEALRHCFDFGKKYIDDETRK